MSHFSASAWTVVYKAFDSTFLSSFVLKRNLFDDFQVKVTKRDDESKEEKFIRNLYKGDFFGEKALQG